MRDIISPRAALLILCILSLLALLAAFTAQYGFDLQPCQFCLYERYPYAIALGLSLMGLLKESWLRGLRVAFMVIFTAATLLTAYHVAVEREWVDPPASCQSNLQIGANTTVEDLKNQILNQPRVTRCDIVPLRILGISMADGNLLFSLLLMAFAFYFLREQEEEE